MRLIDIKTNVNEVEKQSKYTNYGNAIGKTQMKLEWQIFDKSTGKVALKKITKGTYKYRQGMYYHVSTIMPSFELGISQLFHDEEFIKMVSESDVETGLLVDSKDSTKNKILLDKVELPAFSNLSKMIQYASTSCVTIITDGGHGSGVNNK